MKHASVRLQVTNLLGGDQAASHARLPSIMADAAYVIIAQPRAANVTGNFFIDDDTLRAVGKADMSEYAVKKGTADEDMIPDLFV